MFKKLALKDRYTDCQYCNTMGCQWSIDKHGKALGHWLWVYDSQVKRPVLNALNVKRQYKRFKYWLTALDHSKIEDIEVDGIDTRDYPDFSDAYISSATYKGREMTDSELDRLNDDRDFVYECVIERVF